MKMRRIFFSAIWAAAMPSFGVGAATPPAGAVPASELEPVRINAPATPAVRLDVKTACPAIEGDLQRMLGPAWGRVGLAGTMQVQFRVEKRQVTDVHAFGVSSDYRPYIRKAVAKLACSGDAVAVQDFRFLLVIHDPLEATSPAYRFAVLETK